MGMVSRLFRYICHPTCPSFSTTGVWSYTQNTRFGRYFIPTEDIANKFRAGVCLSNEFIIGRLTAVLQWGVYVYDPIRNATHDPHPVYGDNRPMLYSYDIEKEEIKRE
jgi:hypothetical protein